MNILFTHSYFLHFDPKQLATAQPYPPLGTLYAAALMKKNGHTVSLFDTMFSSNPNEISQAITNQKPDCLELYLLPYIGFAHQLHLKGHPLVVPMLIEK